MDKQTPGWHVLKLSIFAAAVYGRRILSSVILSLSKDQTPLDAIP
jgi:hypothetical protein